MADFLFIRPAAAPAAPATPPAPAEAAWVAVDAAGALLAPPSSGSLADAKPLAEGKRVVLLAPAADVMTTRVVLPAASPARMRQMVPFSLEDTLADDVEDLAFAVGGRDGAAVSVSVVAKDRLDAWLRALAAVELVPSAAYSEADGVPDTPGTLTVVLEGPRAFCRRAGEPPLALEGLDLASVLELALPNRNEARAEAVAGDDGDETDASNGSGSGNGEETPEAAADTAAHDKVLILFDEAARALHAHDLARLDELGPQAEQRFMADGALPHLAATLASSPGTNLLQGAYAPKSNWASLARPWRLAATLAGIALLLGVFQQAAGYMVLRREDAALTAAVGAGCQQVVGTDREGACRSEVQSRLRSAGAGGGGAEVFIAMVTAVADSLGPAMQLNAMTFRDGELTLDISGASVDALDRFTTAVRETGRFEASIERMGSESTHVKVAETP